MKGARVRWEDRDERSSDRNRARADPVSGLARRQTGFDLNIEKILEDWETRHAVREIIANALDEQLLSGTREIVIGKNRNGAWQIRDYGRGLSHSHLSQKENPEKLSNPRTIGKFGIGLKDALGVLHRTGVEVVIQSRFGAMRVGMAPKHGFEDIRTLHVFQEPPRDPDFQGTLFTLTGVSDPEIIAAKMFFLKFTGDRVLDETKYGAILEATRKPASIYVNGVRVAEEENFLFGYDIRSPNKTLRKALNRERTNVGRAAYQGRVKDVLLATQNQDVARALAEDLRNLSLGTQHDELQWIDVQKHAVKILNTSGRFVFLSSEQAQFSPSLVDQARRDGKVIVTISSALASGIIGELDIKGNAIIGLQEFQAIFDASFEFKFVEPSALTRAERQVFDLTDDLLNLVGGKPSNVREIRVSETMRPEAGSLSETGGVFEPDKRRVVIKRSQLSDNATYAGTLLHEVAHAVSGRPDVDRDFEGKLTQFLGTFASGLVTIMQPAAPEPVRRQKRNLTAEKRARGR